MSLLKYRCDAVINARINEKSRRLLIKNHQRSSKIKAFLLSAKAPRITKGSRALSLMPCPLRRSEYEPSLVSDTFSRQTSNTSNTPNTNFIKLLTLNTFLENTPLLTSILLYSLNTVQKTLRLVPLRLEARNFSFTWKCTLRTR